MSTTSAIQSETQSTRRQPGDNDATRYLCAAAYLNEHFAQAVLDEVVHQHHRAVAPSHGIDLGPIIRHTLAARRRTLVRDGVITAALLLGLVVAFIPGFLVLMSFLSLGLLIRGVRLLRIRQTIAGLGYVVLAILLSGPLTWLIALAVVALLSSQLYWLYPYGSPFEELPFADLVALGRPSIWVVVILIIWVTCLVYRLMNHRTIAVELAPDGYDPRRAPAVDRIHQARIDYIEQAQSGNVSVYSQGIAGRPFVGFGVSRDSWTMVSPLRLRNPPPDLDPAAPESFTVDQLYEAIRTGLVALADPRLPPDHAVPHFSVRDRVFLAGRLPVNSPYLDHDRPRFRLSDPEVKFLQRSERGRARHYQVVRMMAWNGEVEATTFLYASIRGHTLFVEFEATMMPGIHAAYHDIDTYERLDGVTTLRAMGRAVGDVIRSPLAVVALVRTGRARIRRALDDSTDDQRISRQLAFDYGYRSSVRELGANFDSTEPFQIDDADERIKVVANRLIHVLVNFLDQQGYDVGSISGQAATVINNNTRVDNGNVFHNSTLNSASVAAGTSARASTRTAPPPSSPAPPA